MLVAALATSTGWHDDVVAAALPLERARFFELSEKLCAMSIDDGFPADAIQNALADQFAANDFRRIAELLHSAGPQDIDRLVASTGLDKLAKSIISVWYSGLLGTGETTRVLASEDALAWRATDYAKAPGTCGEFGVGLRNHPLPLLVSADRECSAGCRCGDHRFGRGGLAHCLALGRGEAQGPDPGDRPAD